jgi:hypothetical protein
VDGWKYKFGLSGILKGWFMSSRQEIQFQYAFQAALYLGLRKKEWLFLTSHNHWIVIRLVTRTNAPPFLTFSPLITMEDSSVPFRTFLGAILSVVKGGIIEPSVFNDLRKLDTIEEQAPKEEEPPLSPSDGGRSAQDNLSLTVRPSRARFYLNRLKFTSIGFNLFPTFFSVISTFDPCPFFAEQSVRSSNSPH